MKFNPLIKLRLWLLNLFNKKKHYSGVLVPEPDSRDWRWDIKVTKTLAPHHSDIDLRDSLQSLRNQGAYNSCTGFSRAKLLESAFESLFNITPFRVSPKFIWHIGQEEHDWLGSNNGVDMRYSFKALFKKGFVPEITYPYVSPLNTEDFEEAKKFAKALPLQLLKDFGFYMVRPTDIPSVLHAGMPVCVGMYLNSDFMIKGKKYISNDKPSDKRIAHDMLCVGQEGDYYIFANSWGKDIGEGGFQWVSKEYVHENAFHNITIYYRR